MTTKDYCGIIKGENGKSFGINNLSDQYSNIDLNKSHKCSSRNSGHTKIISKNEEKKKFSNNPLTEKGSDLTDSKNSKTSWKNSDKKLCNYFELDSDEIGKKNNKKNDKNSSSSDKNSSTLSLHIAAYENFIETKNEKSDDGKDGLKDLKKHGKSCLNMQILGSKTSPDMMNSFEFPRQQEDKKYPESEISQFRASQRLFTPNQSNSSTQNRPNRINPISNVRSVRPPPPSNRPSLLNQGNTPRLVNQLISSDINLDSGSLANLYPALASNNAFIQALISDRNLATTNLQFLSNMISNQLQQSPQSSTLNLPIPALGGDSTSEPDQQQMVLQVVPERHYKFRAVMEVAEKIVKKDQFNPETFTSELNEECTKAGMQGKLFSSCWNRYKSGVETRWKRNGQKFVNADDEKFYGIQKCVDNSFCMPEDKHAKHYSTDASSMKTQNSTAHNSFNHALSDVENCSSNSNVDESSSQINSLRRSTRRGRKRRIRSLSPDFGSPFQSAASWAENGSYVRGSFNFPSITSLPPLPMPNNLTVDEHSFAKKAATKSKMASSNDDKTNPFQSEVEVDENVTVPSENQNSENLQPSDSVTVEPNVTITAAEIAETPSEITVGLSPFFSAPLSTSPSNISSSLASEARQQQSQQFAANLQAQSPAQMHEQFQQQIFHSGQSDLFTIISNQIRTMENQTNSMAKLMEKQLDAFKTNSK